MSLYHVCCELSSALPLSPHKTKRASKKLQKRNPPGKLGGVEKAQPESEDGRSPSPTFRKRLSSLLSSRPRSAPPSPCYPTDVEYYSFPSPFNPLVVPPVTPVSCTASARVTTSSASSNPTSSQPQASSLPTPKPLGQRQSWSTSTKRRTSRLSLDLTTFLEETRSTTRNPTQEIEDFLAGGRENPNPYLYEADMIRRMGGELGLVSLSQMRDGQNLEAVEVERCQVHGVMTQRGRCSGCLVSRLEGELEEERILRQRV